MLADDSAEERSSVFLRFIKSNLSQKISENLEKRSKRILQPNSTRKCYETFVKTACVCKGKNSRRQSISVETIFSFGRPTRSKEVDFSRNRDLHIPQQCVREGWNRQVLGYKCCNTQHYMTACNVVRTFLKQNQSDVLISQIYSGNETLRVSDSSSVYHQEFFTVNTTMIYVIQVCWQVASRIRIELQFHPDPVRKLSANLYDIYHCCVYSEKLLMMDRGTVRNI
jgi:hypothetical protein